MGVAFLFLFVTRARAVRLSFSSPTSMVSFRVGSSRLSGLPCLSYFQYPPLWSSTALHFLMALSMSSWRSGSTLWSIMVEMRLSLFPIWLGGRLSKADDPAANVVVISWVVERG